MMIGYAQSRIQAVGGTPTAGSRVLGFGAAQPEHVVHAHELGERFDRTAEWIRTRTGITALRRIQPGEDIVELAVQAGRSALARAALTGAEIDLVITASCSLDAESSARIAQRLASRAAPLAINAACSGFCYAISIADALIRTGAAHRVLVVAAEHMSRLIDPDDLATSILFGDGAGAAVLGEAGADGIGVGPAIWGSDGAQSELIACGSDGLLRMAGQHVFRWAVARMPDLAVAACKRAGVGIEDIDVFVPHQANLRIVHAITAKIGLQRAVIASDISGSGNTSAASIPIALARIMERREARSGQLALILGFGAGLAYAGQVIALP